MTFRSSEKSKLSTCGIHLIPKSGIHLEKNPLAADTVVLRGHIMGILAKMS